MHKNSANTSVLALALLKHKGLEPFGRSLHLQPLHIVFGYP